MPLEHEPGPSQQVKLSEAEVSQLLDAAIARHKQAQALPEKVLSVDDALEIARTMGIPEEHVHEAAAELQRRRTTAGVPAVLTEDERRRRGEVVRSRRAQKFLLSLAGGAAVLTGIIVLSAVFYAASWAAMLILGVTLVVVVRNLVRWLFGGVTDAELESVEVPPLPGRCRVCGAPAYTPQATFCEQHRYKGPG